MPNKSSGHKRRTRPSSRHAREVRSTQQPARPAHRQATARAPRCGGPASTPWHYAPSGHGDAPPPTATHPPPDCTTGLHRCGRQRIEPATGLPRTPSERTLLKHTEAPKAPLLPIPARFRSKGPSAGPHTVERTAGEAPGRCTAPASPPACHLHPIRPPPDTTSTESLPKDREARELLRPPTRHRAPATPGAGDRMTCRTHPVKPAFGALHTQHTARGIRSPATSGHQDRKPPSRQAWPPGTISG